MTKTLEENFKDWGASALGFGYGTGEPHTIPALRAFLELCNETPYGNGYDYDKLEEALTPTVAWLLINILCGCGIIDYGTSPRYGSLTERGMALRKFVLNHTAEQLIEMVCEFDSNYMACGPDFCNCGPNGYEEGRQCPNPFWEPEAWRRTKAKENGT